MSKEIYDSKIYDEIIERVSAGEFVHAICRDDHMPNPSTFYRAMSRDSDLAQRFLRARELGAIAIAEQAIDDVDAMPERGPDGKIDQGDVAHKKLKFYAREKMLAVWDRKRFGTKVVHEGNPDAPLVTAIKRVIVKPKQDDDSTN